MTGALSISRTPKGGKDQTIPLNSAAKELLLNHPRTQTRLSCSLAVAEGKGPDIRSAIDRIRENGRTSQDFRPLHGLRHTYASMLASSGQVDLYTLQKLLTHKSAAMTQRYAHLRDDTLRRASDLAGELLNRAVNGNGKKVVNREE